MTKFWVAMGSGTLWSCPFLTALPWSGAELEVQAGGRPAAPAGWIPAAEAMRGPAARRPRASRPPTPGQAPPAGTPPD